MATEAALPHTDCQALRADVDRLCDQLDSLVEENSRLEAGHQLPVTEMTLNPGRLADLQEKLVNTEVGVVREVERGRLHKLLQCHHLKDASWDSMLVKAASLCSICSDVTVRNYPIRAPKAGAWGRVLDVVRSRLEEVAASRGAPVSGAPAPRSRKTGVSKRASIADDQKPPLGERKPSVEEAKLSPEEVKPPADEGEDLEPVLCEAEYRDLLYQQTELTCRERVERQLVLITFLTRRLRENFNSRFDALHQKKGRVIEEVYRLNRKRQLLKEELAKMEAEGVTSGSGSREAPEGGPTPTHPQEEEREEEEEVYEPSWEEEERPELMLHVDHSEVTADDWSDYGAPCGTPGTARAAPDTADGQSSAPGTATLTTREPWETPGSSSIGQQPPLEAGPGEPWTSGGCQIERPRKDWTWAEARAWREWKAAQEEHARRRRAHATTLSLQLERITPTIANLLQEFDSQVMSLVDSRVSTDKALLLYQLVTSRLHHRLVQQHQLQDTLSDLQEQRRQVSERVSLVETEEEATRREEARAKGRQERLQEQLREEETALRRALINLPIEQYNHLLGLYSKRLLSSGHHLDLPSARGLGGGGEGVSTPLTPTCSTPLSPSSALPPATPEGGGTRRGSVRYSRPASSTSHSDDQMTSMYDSRPGEECMPEGLAGGARTWRQFQRYRRRRQDLVEEAEEAASKRSSATSHLQTLDAHRQSLLQEVKQLDESISSTSHDLRLLDEDLELVLVLNTGQVKVDLDLMTANLSPEFSETRLVPQEELRKLENTAELSQTYAEGEGPECEPDGAGEEVEALRAVKGQLELQVQMARHQLHQITTFKVGRDVMRAAAGVVAKSVQQDPSQMYASLQRLQQLQGRRAEGVAAEASQVEDKIHRTRRKVELLQRQVDDLAREIDDLQTKVSQAQPEVLAARRETRLRRVMACSDLTSQVRQRQGTILDLEQELDTLRLRTFPMLHAHHTRPHADAPRPPHPPTR